MRLFVRPVASFATSLILGAFIVPALHAQPGVGATLTPYAGYLVTGNWYDGPIGTSISTTNSPMDFSYWLADRTTQASQYFSRWLDAVYASGRGHHLA